MAEAPPEVAVPEELASVPLERVTRGPDPVDREVGGLELLDQPVAGLTLDAAVQAPGQNGRPVLDGDPRLEMDLAAVSRVRVLSLAEDAGVDLRAEAEAPPAVAPIEAHAAEALVLGELAHGDLEHPGCFVKAQPVDYNLRVRSSARFSTRFSALFILLAFGVSVSPLPATSRPSATKAKVAPSLEAALTQAALRPPATKSGVSIYVADLETGETVFERNGSTPETIASVTKLFSTAAALHYLGPAYKFGTTFWRRGDIKRRQPAGIPPGRRGRRPEHLRALLRRRLIRHLRQVGRGPASGGHPAASPGT